jgi:hypothetical protein
MRFSILIVLVPASETAITVGDLPPGSLLRALKIHQLQVIAVD